MAQDHTRSTNKWGNIWGDNWCKFLIQTKHLHRRLLAQSAVQSKSNWANLTNFCISLYSLYHASRVHSPQSSHYSSTPLFHDNNSNFAIFANFHRDNYYDLIRICQLLPPLLRFWTEAILNDAFVNGDSCNYGFGGYLGLGSHQWSATKCDRSNLLPFHLHELVLFDEHSHWFRDEKVQWIDCFDQIDKTENSSWNCRRKTLDSKFEHVARVDQKSSILQQKAPFCLLKFPQRRRSLGRKIVSWSSVWYEKTN